MLRRAILLTAVLILPGCFLYGIAEGGPVQSPVEAEEYAAYSAYLNQKYIPRYTTSMYTLQGALIRDGKLGKVIIFANTRQEFANVSGVSRYMLQLFMGQEANQEAEKTFSDLISKNAPPARLSNAFDLSVPYELAGNKEGLLSFSRVGFDAVRSKALFLVAQVDVSSRPNQQPTETTYLVLLNKENGQWKVNKVWRHERKSFEINLGRCEKTSQHIPLPLGSEGFTISGRKGNRCVIEHMQEMEQGYTRTRCRVPVGLRKLTIFESGLKSNVFVFSMDLTKYCEKPVHGNTVLDAIKLLRRKPKRLYE